MTNSGEINERARGALSIVYREQRYFNPTYYGDTILGLHEQEQLLREIIGHVDVSVAAAEGSKIAKEPMEEAGTALQGIAEGSGNEHLLAAAEASSLAAGAIAHIAERDPAVKEQWRTYFDHLVGARVAAQELQVLLTASKEDSEQGNAACETALQEGERFLPYV